MAPWSWRVLPACPYSMNPHGTGVHVLQELQLQVAHRDERAAEATEELRLVVPVDDAVLVRGERLGLGGDFDVGLPAFNGPAQLAGENLVDLGIVGAGHPQVVDALHFAVRIRGDWQLQRVGEVGYNPACACRLQKEPARPAQPRLRLGCTHVQPGGVGVNAPR